MTFHPDFPGRSDLAGLPIGPSLILDNPVLWVGYAKLAREQDGRWDAIVNLCASGNAFGGSIWDKVSVPVLELQFEDRETPQRMWETQRLIADLAVTTAEGWLKMGKKVLICCGAGHSRSPLIAAIVVARLMSWSFEKAYALVQERRPGISAGKEEWKQRIAYSLLEGTPKP